MTPSKTTRHQRRGLRALRLFKLDARPYREGGGWIRALLQPGLHLLLSHRVRVALCRSPLAPLDPLLKLVQFYLFKVDLSSQCHLGAGVRFPHPIGLVIGHGVKVGRGVSIFQNVTMGGKRRADRTVAYPVIESGAKIFGGSSIIGGVTVGSGAIVGANSVVVKDVPAQAVVAGAPAGPLARQPIRY